MDGSCGLHLVQQHLEKDVTVLGVATVDLMVEGDGVDFVNAEKSGVFLPEKQYGAKLHKGDVIGRIVSALTGEVLSVATANEDGLLMTIRAYPIVYEGSVLARIIKD